MTLEVNDLSDKQCLALLKSPCPLGDVFKDFEKRETGYMDEVRDTLECRANKVIREDLIQAGKEER